MQSIENPVWDVPRSTYRLQFSHRFTFADARRIIPYLVKLGVSHVYASPIFKARAGSEHGYDITDHNSINPELGGVEQFAHFSNALSDAGLGLIVDFVPNHMGVARSDNAWWLDILEHGQSSPFSRHFDIDWMPPKPELHGKVLLPVLGDHYGVVLGRGELELKFDSGDGTLAVHYHEHRLPLRPRTYAAVIRRQLGAATSSIADWSKFESLANRFDAVRRASRKGVAAMRGQVAALKQELSEYCRTDSAAAQFMADAAHAFVVRQGDSNAARALHVLLERQHYRLAFWRAAADEINYRRFFDINDLAALRIEEPAVFEATHRLLGQLIAQGRIHGLRIDHVDGLFDPEAYLKRLQTFACARRADAGITADMPFYIVVEKILAHGENLPSGWPVAGTTGYEFATLANGLFVDSANGASLQRVYRHFTGQSKSFDGVVLAAKRLVIDTMLAGELNVLANQLDRISERSWDTRDYTFQRLRDALREIVCHFPVYRTYVSNRGISLADRRAIAHAVSRARHHWPGPDREIFAFVQDALTGDLAKRGKPFRRAEILRFAMHFQQYSGPIMAKAVEDTSFYRFVPLLSLNEVGGNPAQLGGTVDDFHATVQARAKTWPQSMLATTTHDTKRGEDVRARLNVLSEIPLAWQENLDRWGALNAKLRTDIQGRTAPSQSEEYLLYQTLLGVWPPREDRSTLSAVLTPRIQGFLTKALREAKINSGWDDPNLEYEAAVSAFAGALLDEAESSEFLAHFSRFAGKIEFFGAINALSQLVLKMLSPGVPDIYQGAELWELSLVDPDNRRAVDFDLRVSMLDEFAVRERRRTGAALTSARTKLELLNAALLARRRNPSLFRHGRYQAVVASGFKAPHAIAFSRNGGSSRIIAICPRIVVGLLGADATTYDAACWGDTTLPAAALGGVWRDLVSSREFQFRGKDAPLAEILCEFPIAILESLPT